jgi:type I restriction enzyme S subunit
MKKGWQTKKLGDLCDVIGGGTPPKDKPAFYSGTIPWATVRDMRQDVITETEFRITKDAVKGSATNIIPSGNVVIATRVGLGKVCLLGQDTAINQDLRGLVPRSEKTLVVRYLYWWLKGIADVIIANGTGATVQGVKLPFVKSLQIPVPPLPEQQRIVALLDEAFAGLATAQAHAERNLRNARALFESHLNAVFTQRGEGWVEKPLGELCDASRVITYGVIKLGDEVTNGVPCLRTSNVRWLHIDTGGIKRIAASLSSEYSRTILKGGEVLVSVRGTLGGVAVATPEMAGWNVSREVAVVPVNPKRVDPEFLSYLIGSGASQHWLGGVKKGAAYVGINIEDLRLLPVSAPAMEKQIEVVQHLKSLQEETQRLTRLYERKLAAQAALKQSLLHQAFSGAL